MFCCCAKRSHVTSLAGKDEGFISSKSVSESDISETASEESEEKIDSTLIDDCSETCSMDYTDDANGMECNS